MRVVERFGGVGALRPAGGLELPAGARHVEIGDARDMHAARQPRLRQEHGAELAGSDHADGDWPASGFAFKQLGMQVHAIPSAFCLRMIFAENRFSLLGSRAKRATQTQAARRHKRRRHLQALALKLYWQRARETKVSEWQSGPLLRPAR